MQPALTVIWQSKRRQANEEIQVKSARIHLAGEFGYMDNSPQLKSASTAEGYPLYHSVKNTAP